MDDNTRQLITAMLDMQYELAEANTKIAQLKAYFAKENSFLASEVAVILGIKKPKYDEVKPIESIDEMNKRLQEEVPY
jgi:hypothetical protein